MTTPRPTRAQLRQVEEQRDAVARQLATAAERERALAEQVAELTAADDAEARAFAGCAQALDGLGLYGEERATVTGRILTHLGDRFGVQVKLEQQPTVPPQIEQHGRTYVLRDW